MKNNFGKTFERWKMACFVTSRTGLDRPNTEEEMMINIPKINPEYL
jgi:hypothetical protein